MLQKKQGFTLVEIVLTLTLSVLLLITLFTLFNAFFHSFSTAAELSNAQINAHTTLKIIELKMRDANYLNIETGLPPEPNANYFYIYNLENNIKAKDDSGETALSRQDNIYREKFSCSRVNDKVVKLTVSVMKGSQVVYRQSADISPNNLKSNNITGLDEGECIAFKVNTSSFRAVSNISVVSGSAFIHSDGETMEFSAQIAPENASIHSVAWSVSDMEVARIAQNGVLTPLKNGFVTVIATAMDGSGVTGGKQITIINQKTVITDLRLISSTGSNQLKKGGHSLTILPIITPEDADNKLITWTIDNPGLAVIGANGVLTSKNTANRSVMITATTNDGSNFIATIEIQIVE